MNEYTAPWQYDPQFDGDGDVYGADHFVTAGDGSIEICCAKNRSDGLLIAAAPELLEALKYARRMLFRDGSDCDLAYIDAAISKATNP